MGWAHSKASLMGPAHGREQTPPGHTLGARLSLPHCQLRAWGFSPPAWLGASQHSAQGPSHHHPSSLKPHGAVHSGGRQGAQWGCSGFPDTCLPGPWLGRVAGNLEEQLEEERPEASCCLEAPRSFRAQGPFHTCTELFLAHLAGTFHAGEGLHSPYSTLGEAPGIHLLHSWRNCKQGTAFLEPPCHPCSPLPKVGEGPDLAKVWRWRPAGQQHRSQLPRLLLCPQALAFPF